VKSHHKNIHVSFGRLVRILIHLSRLWENLLSRLTFFSCCDFGVELPKSTIFAQSHGIVVGCGVLLGENVVIDNQVTLGSKDMELGNMPKIGDGAVIGVNALLTKKCLGSDCDGGKPCFT
jgi:serine acetyltransferase